jgi:hypothetical protein
MNKLRYSFRYLDEKLNRHLIHELEAAGVTFTVDDEGMIYYGADHIEIIENAVLSRFRTRIYPKWQIISCPSDWTESYRKYMFLHEVPFTEELIDRQVCFLIPRNYRPHSWKLAEPQGMAAH